MLESIFIKVPSLDDNELVPTLLDAIEKADNPYRLHFGVSLMWSDEKYPKDLIKFVRSVKWMTSNFKIVTQKYNKNMLGVGKQRKIVGDMYNGEDYILQIDSHTWFTEDWDTKLIDLHKECHYPNAILTAYAGRYQYIDGKRTPIEGGLLRYPWIHKGERQYCGFTDNWEDLPYEGKAKYVPVKFCANFAFGPKEWGTKTGLAADSVFFSEEPLQTEYLKLNGFQLVFPNIDYPLICHLYHQHMTEESERKAFTDYLTDDEADYLMNIQDREVYENHMIRIEHFKHIT